MFAIAIGTVIVSVGGSCLPTFQENSGIFADAPFQKHKNSLYPPLMAGTPTLARATSDINNIQQILMMALQMILPAPMIVAASIFLTGTVFTDDLGPNRSDPIFSMIAYGVIRKAIPLSQITQKLVDKMMRILRETLLALGDSRHSTKLLRKRTDRSNTDGI